MMVGGDGSPRETERHDEERRTKDLGGGQRSTGVTILTRSLRASERYNAKVGLQALKWDVVILS
jgi:hypothetical protein